MAETVWLDTGAVEVTGSGTVWLDGGAVELLAGAGGAPAFANPLALLGVGRAA